MSSIASAFPPIRANMPAQQNRDLNVVKIVKEWQLIIF